MQTINTNLAALMVQRNLEKSQNSLLTSLQRLSSGLRINSAMDDPAGLAIADRMGAKIRGMTQARRNANDAISMAQTGEGAITQQIDILQRIRELAVQSINGSNSNADRQAMNAEVMQLVAELDRIAQTSEFNGQKLFDGNASNTAYQIGPNAGNTLSINAPNLRTHQYGSYLLGSGAGSGILSWSHALTGTDRYFDGTSGTVNVASGAILSAGSLNINGAQVSLLNTDMASTIAAKINHSAAGVQASARTEAMLSLGSGHYDLMVGSKSSAFTAVHFNINDDNQNGQIDHDEYAAAINAFNAKSSKTGVLAQLQAFSTTAGETSYGIQLLNEEGNNIVLASDAAATNGFGGGVSIWNYDPLSSSGSIQRRIESVLNIPSSGSVSFAGQVRLSDSHAFSISSDSTLETRNGVIYNGANNGALLPNALIHSILSAVDKLDVSSVNKAIQALSMSDQAMETLNTERSKLGAFQNRMGFTMAYLDNSIETTSAARSRIMDADFAAETASLVRSQILIQAGTAMLTIANAMPNQVLSLLKTIGR
ncbi:flagellin [Iodobacter sp.]|uniref:flagellin N-terminal helical domain-containing protein n=1 Tax=Iodobacter sp. TaxID=1915058 RepID=UPI0025D26965|nr:flagellin [Iodobacter sp.]